MEKKLCFCQGYERKNERNLTPITASNQNYRIKPRPKEYLYRQGLERTRFG